MHRKVTKSFGEAGPTVAERRFTAIAFSLLSADSRHTLSGSHSNSRKRSRASGSLRLGTLWATGQHRLAVFGSEAVAFPVFRVRSYRSDRHQKADVSRVLRIISGRGRAPGFWGSACPEAGMAEILPAPRFA